jgi:hypothetical protein
MNLVFIDFITGVCLGLEIFTGDDAEPDDVFAVCIDLLIVRITYVRKKA